MEPEPSPPQKSREDFDAIFHQFLENEQLYDKLHAAYSIFLHGGSRLNLCSLQIQSTDAVCATSFTHAHCRTTRYTTDVENRRVKTCRASYLFYEGMAVLKEFLCKECPKVPQDKSTRRALAKLLKFLSSDHAVLISSKDDQDEYMWAVILAQHLLSELVVGTRFTLDTKYTSINLKKKSSGEYLCPCESEDTLQGTFGDTSFGCENAWHGRTDIFLENTLPVSFAANTSRDCLSSDSSDDGNETSVEDFQPKDFDQMIAQTIVFSFLQCSIYEKLEDYPIPSLGFSKNKVIIHFYDCKNDLLLQSDELDLFSGGEIISEVLIFIWMTLNYKSLCSGTIEPLKNDKSGFFEKVGTHIEKYKKEIMKPCRSVLSYYDPLQKNWSASTSILYKGTAIKGTFRPLKKN